VAETDAYIPEMSVELDEDDLEEVTEEQLQAKGYEFEPIEDEKGEEVMLEVDEFELDFLLATDKAGADIDKTEEPIASCCKAGV
jgi:hypothetical protein